MKQTILRAVLGAATLFLVAPAATAQAALHAPQYRLELGLGAGKGEHTTDGSNLDDRTDAGFFRFSFEGIGDSGLGGGLRLEGWSTDDDLFGLPAEATASTLFAHFTWRYGDRRHTVPIRVGLLVNGYEIGDSGNDDLTAATVGLLGEVAPEIVLAGDDDIAWTVFGTANLGFGSTQIEVDGLGDDFVSWTTFVGLELGTRVRFEHFDVGLSLAYRRQATDESDEDNGFVVLGYDAEFTGVLLSLGFCW